MESESESTVDEQRLADRSAVEVPVRLWFAADPIEGKSDNLSEAGVMLFTDSSLRVSAEIRGPEGTRTVQGRLVRVQRMNERTTGLAVEFDPE